LYQLLDVLIWFKMHVDSNPKTGNWVKIEAVNETTEIKTYSIQGKVINTNRLKGFAFFKPDSIGENVYIPPNLVSNHSLIDGMTITVEIEEYIDSKTNELKSKVKRILF